jgi:hypothetical protein
MNAPRSVEPWLWLAILGLVIALCWTLDERDRVIAGWHAEPRVDNPAAVENPKSLDRRN